MNAVIAFITIPVLVMLLIPFLSVKWKGVIIISSVILNAIISGYIAVQTLSGQTFDYVLSGSLVSGPIHLKIYAQGF
jgi:hypothetical protein